MFSKQLFSPPGRNRNSGAGDAEAAGYIDTSVTAGKGDMADDASGVGNLLHPALRYQFRQRQINLAANLLNNLLQR